MSNPESEEKKDPQESGAGIPCGGMLKSPFFGLDSVAFCGKLLYPRGVWGGLIFASLTLNIVLML